WGRQNKAFSDARFWPKLIAANRVLSPFGRCRTHLQGRGLRRVSGGPAMPARQEEKVDTIDAIAEAERLPADIDAQPVVQAAAALRPELRRYKDEIEREQRFPK